MPKFRKKPVEIEAIQWDGANTTSVINWAQGGWGRVGPLALNGKSIWIKQVVVDPDKFPVVCVWRLVIPTLEGDHEASPGDWIIRGVKGEIYPCKPDIFAATYEPVEGGKDG